MASGDAKPRASSKFLNWAVEECWESHLEQRRRFYERVTGSSAPGPSPVLDGTLAKTIREAVLRKDRHLVESEDRERFKRESRARASGVGIFLDRWCTGRDPRNDVSTGQGRRYLESWRPWRIQQGKGDPVDKFSELYFEAKARQDQVRGAS